MADDDAMLNIAEVCEFFGGARSPVSDSTIYRWIKEGKLAKPIKISSMTSRWRRSDCEAALKKMQQVCQT